MRPRPEHYLMRLSDAARQLGVEIGEALELAERHPDCGDPLPLRLAIRVGADAHLWPSPMRCAPIAGLHDIDRLFAYIGFQDVKAVTTAVRAGGSVTLQWSILWMVDGSGITHADGIEVNARALWVPRVDVQALGVSDDR